MYCYMINTAQIGEYHRAFDYSRKTFQSKDPQEMAKNSSTIYRAGEKNFYLKSLGEEIKVTYPAGEVTFVEKELPPVWEWQLLILNYLSRADGKELAGKLITYRELEGGEVFFPAFKKNSIDYLTNKLAQEQPDQIIRACQVLGGSVEQGKNIKAVFQFLPSFPVTFNFWPADEELPASANILFDQTANSYLHTEDVAVVGSLLAEFIYQQIQIEE